MRFIPSFLHGLLDYLTGITFVVIPWLFGIPRHSISAQLFIALGVITIIYSLLTNYEFGVIRLIPFRIHLIIDLIAGLFLALAPWIFGFADPMSRYVGPHVGFGLFEICVGLLTIPRVLGFREVFSTRY